MSEPVEWLHHQSWFARPTDVSEARHFVQGHLVDHGLVEMVDAARLVVSELSTNAIQHARTPFSVQLERQDGSVLLSVADGTGHLPESGPAGGVTLATRGRGLQIVQAFSSDWGVNLTDDGKIVWASFAVTDA
jgi:anti-sigma regulatory factor (Ser/Thr protein kinase)